jgi:hypothetical protein
LRFQEVSFSPGRDDPPEISSDDFEGNGEAYAAAGGAKL